MAEQGHVGISRIYVKDLSFESPQAPEIFRKEFQPEVKIDISVKHQELENQLYEVCVEVTATGSREGKNIFIVEVEQAGVFQIRGVNPENMKYVMNVYCPNVLFPYARQTVDAAMSAGGFPPLHLPPFNFEALKSSG